jgi:hypothetical protein
MSADIHLRAEGDVTGLEAALGWRSCKSCNRAGVYLSSLGRGLVFPLFDLLIVYVSSSSPSPLLDVPRIHHDGLMRL